MADGKTVLIVEDDALIRLALADAMAEAGCVVLEASDALEAIAVLGGIHIDAMVTDVDMPGALNGLHLATMASNICPRVLTAVSSGRHEVRTELPEGVLFFPKPASFRDLTQVIVELLSNPSERLKLAS
jgi:DNA-binding NtrC family response regulator